MLIKHNNKRCVVPPGELTVSEGQPIIVASLMRSGTHILIDAILNNLESYRNNPLYIDLHKFFKSDLSEDLLLQCGSYVCKTHYPQNDYSKKDVEVIRTLAEKSIIVVPERDIESIYRSVIDYGYDGDLLDLTREIEGFEAFWSQFNPIRIRFESMFDSEEVKCLLQKISERSGSSLQADNVIMPRPKDKIYLAKYDKLLTRLLGFRAPVINTTVRLAKTKHSCVIYDGQ